MRKAKPLSLWILSDKRLGHLNQSLALQEAIHQYRVSMLHVIELKSAIDPLLILFGTHHQTKHLPEPDIIIGTGHHTHLASIAAKFRYKCKAVIIMKPSLPFFLFDLLLIPSHDMPKHRKNIIITEGALSRVRPRKKTVSSQLIIIGGPSKHFDINGQNLIKKISTILEDSSNKILINLTDSPRTPNAIRRQIASTFSTLYRPWENYSLGELQEQMSTSTTIWITEDSMSMIYDSLSSGAQVVLIDIERKDENRISTAIDSLLSRNIATSYSEWLSTKKIKRLDPPLNEAARCAQTLLKKFDFL